MDAGLVLRSTTLAQSSLSQPNVPDVRLAKASLAKIKQAGAQFEAVLLNSVFGGLEQTFSRLPGTHQNSTSTSYDSLAMQALTSGLAQSGGIGLGKLLAEKLIESQRVKAF